MKSLRYSFPCTLSIALFFCLVTTTALQAQYQDGLKRLQEKKFAEALSLFQSLKPQSPVLERMGMSKYYSAVENPQIQLDSAYSAAVQAEKAYKALEEKEKTRIIKMLEGETAAKNRQAVEKKLIEAAIAQKNIEALNRVIALLGSNARTKTAEETRNALAFEAASKAGTLEAMSELFTQYGSSLSLKSVPTFRSASFRLFELYTQSEGWAAHPKFKEKYALAAWARDTVVLAFGNALKSTPPALERFAEKYANTVFAQIGLDSLSSKVRKQSHWRYCEQVLKKWPQLPAKDSIWMRLYRGYRMENPSVKQLQAFKTRFPAFPFPLLLQQSEANALTFYYDAVIKSDSTTRMRRFLAEYPQHPKKDSVWNKLAIQVRKTAKTPNQLDFLINDPNCPKSLSDGLRVQQKAWVRQRDSLELQQIIRTKRPVLFFKFIDRQPESEFRKRALDSLANLLIKVDSTAATIKYVAYGNQLHLPELMNRLYAKTLLAESVKGLKDFAEKYPKYDPARIKRDIEELEGRKIFKTKYEASQWSAYTSYIQNSAPSHSAFFALQRMIAKDVSKNDWPAVNDSLKKYEPLFKGKNPQYDDMIMAIQQTGKITNFEPVVFPGPIKYSAYSPYLSNNDQLLYFCRRNDSLPIPEDIYVAQRDPQGWSIPKIIPAFGSPETNEAPLSVHPNSNQILLFLRGEIGESIKKDGTWSTPNKLSPVVNFSRWQSDARYIGNSGIIYVAESDSNRDLFVCFKDEDGNWKSPINLGTTINTLAQERAPFLHSDMKTLYFSSEGHPGFGNLDLFMSTRLDDSWTNWSPPKNLGLFFNSTEHDWDFKVNTAGTMGYYTVGPVNASNIVFSKLAASLRPASVYRVEAFILNTLNKPFKGQIQVVDDSTQTVVFSTRPDEKNGLVVIVLPSKNAKLVAISDNETPPIILKVKPKLVEPNSELGKVETIIIKDQGEAILETILFATGTAEIVSEAYPYLEIWTKDIIKKKLSVEIQGHTDNTSSAEFNQTLSENRANAVRDYLISRGCPPEKITARGFGESAPLESNATEEGRAKNRRVVLKRVK